MTITEEQHKALRAPFPPAAVGKLPKLTCKACTQKSCQEHRKARCNVCGNFISTAHIDLDYVGHAEVTDRLLSIDPEWTWEPAALGTDGGPLVRRQGSEATLWIRLTVCGVTRLGVGSVAASAFDAEKQLIGDALRNAAMRFGVALDLWSKNELESALVEEAAPAAADSPIDHPAPSAPAATTTRRPPPAQSNGGPTCGNCHAPIGGEPVRKQNGQFVHVSCSPGAGSTGPLPDNDAHDASPGVGTPEGGEAAGAPTAPPSGPSPKQLGLMHVLLGKLGVPESDKHRFCSALIDRAEPVASLSDLTGPETRRLLDALSAEEAGVAG